MEREERKKRLEQLIIERKKNEEKLEIERRILEMLELFHDKDKVEVLGAKESDKIETEMTEYFPIAWYGRIDWDRLSNKIIIPNKDISQIATILALQNFKKTLPVYLIVGLYKYPVVKTSLATILDNIEEVRSMGADQYIYISKNS